MTDPQPYTREELDGLPEALLFVPSLFVDKDERARLAATLRDYQRVLAENEHLRVAVEMGERELQAVFLALNPDCPAHPGQPNTCDNGVCDCFGAMNMGQQVAALRADAQRWRFVRSRGIVTVNEDGEPCFCAWLRESEIPDTLHPLVVEGGGTKDPEQLDDVVDAARSGGA